MRGFAVVDQVCRRIWANLSVSIGAGITSGPRARAASLTALVPPTEVIFRVADSHVVEEVVATISSYGDCVLDLELPLLRRLGTGAPPSLKQDAVRRLVGQLADPPRAAEDWSRAALTRCTSPSSASCTSMMPSGGQATADLAWLRKFE